MAGHGLVVLQSKHSFDETVGRLQSAFVEKGMLIFAVIDHSGEAEKVGMSMPNTKLLIFGNPKAGTPLMLAAPDIFLGPQRTKLSPERSARS